MARRPAPARAASDRDSVHDIELQLRDLTAWRDGHEKRCEDRAEEFRSTAADIRDEMAGMRRDIGRLVGNALDAKAARPATPAPETFRARLQGWLDVAYKLVAIPGFIALALGVVGAILTALGHGATSAAAHLPPR